jgi:multiple RNA-binding domain-containing protein 1
LALAETHIINETKTYLAKHGVILSSFSGDTPGAASSSRPARSQTTILVKNIPYGTTEGQLRELFEPHGTVTRLLVPPSGTIAVVDFDKPHEADKAFRGVAYRRMGGSIIYLERAPVGVFDDSAPRAPVEDDPDDASSLSRKANEDQEEDEKVETDLRKGTTLYVKNLSFHTTSARLNSAFAGIPGFLFAKVQTKPAPNGGKELSMGYGFVGFKTAEEARRAMGSMQGVTLDGKDLKISFAGRGADADDDEESTSGSKPTKKNGTKMIIKNVPFEATKKDLRDLFSAHFPLKSLRLPKKPFGGSSSSTHLKSHTRGFAFLEFLTPADAQAAMGLLKHTHLLGRHLVLEWAEEEGGEEGLERLREKTKAGVSGSKEMPGRKRKLDFGGKRGVGTEEDPEGY